ncbi:hypothetical protein FZ983_11180 [Azospirillum sp. B21]|uniref:E2 domain-containing protein n=1 Tax=Azospirillum sp. B21 TaxID=2607496 RepID=UPI0011EBBEEA|nr:E2 domain-containing protein [Azospirillum sp. B21]KAA0580157.1 hypothetical protein FZ983_11180 [Azospirillum sp. B21]
MSASAHHAATTVATGLTGLLNSPRLSRLCRTADADGHTIRFVNPGELGLRIVIPRNDGREIPFDVMITVTNGALVVKEDARSADARLPPVCPSRHINPDGSFCLHWPDVEPIEVLDDNGARQWLTALVAFLMLQVKVEITRCWPAEAGWAHGLAARPQWLAEKAASGISMELASQIRFRRLKVDKAGRILLCDGRRIASITKNGGKPETLVGLRRPCLCGAHRRSRPVLRRNCKDHSRLLVKIIQFLHQMQKHEDSHVASLRQDGIACCRSLNDCPMR